jgi:3-hydroxyacyl-[acyl-carrier-protein] dehydratase
VSVLTAAQVLALVPQQRPMRFIDKIVEVDADHIVGSYTWKPEDCAGYSADDTLAPPFKMIEMAAQIGSVAWCIYHMTLKLTPEEIAQLVGFFTQVEGVEFFETVRAGDKVACMASFEPEGYFREGKLVSCIEIQFDGGPKDGRTIMTGSVGGVWVPRKSPTLD